MTKTAVYIATTNGPVQIELISQENIPRSQVVLSGDFVPLPDITEEYQHFVTGKGPVARAFGPFEPPMFSMELSARIESGRSWHLAAFIAHGLASEDRLAGRYDIPVSVIWATGAMGNDFSVTAEHVAIKLDQSRCLFEEARTAGHDLHILAPAGLIDDVDQKAVATMHQVHDARETLRDLSIGTDREKDPSSCRTITHGEVQPSSARLKRWRTWVIAGTSALVLAVIAEIAADWATSGVRDLSPDELAKHSTAPGPQLKNRDGESKVSALSVTDISIQLKEIRPSPETSCAAVHFGSAPGSLVPVRLNEKGMGLASSVAGLCGIQIASTGSDRSTDGRLSVQILSGQFVGHESASFDLGPMHEGPWRLYVPRTLNEPIHYKVYADALNGPVVSISHKVMP